MSYEVIKPYVSYYYGFPITLGVGTKLYWFSQTQGYLSEAVDNHCVSVSKWAVESWGDYFRKVEA